MVFLAKADKDGRIREYAQWVCRCDCGNIVVRREDFFLRNIKKGDAIASCGCYMKGLVRSWTAKDLTGKRFDHLTVLMLWGSEKIGKINRDLYMVQCDCPAKTVFRVRGDQLVEGRTRCCPVCARTNSISNLQSKRSKGEDCICKALDKIGVQYIEQKSFPTLVNPATNKHLFFDIVVPEWKICFEFDGQQHYHIINTFRHTTIAEGIEHQRIKMHWCYENGYQMVIIPFTYLTLISVEFIQQLRNYMHSHRELPYHELELGKSMVNGKSVIVMSQLLSVLRQVRDTKRMGQTKP